MTISQPARSDFTAALALGLVTAVLFGAGAASLGFYNDDIGFLHGLPQIRSLADLWGAMRGFVPGRHLHPLWHYLFWRLSRGSLLWWHVWQAVFDGLVAGALLLLFRRLGVPPAPAVLAAALAAFWPFHGETHFWMLCLPMILVSTLGVLGFLGTTVGLVESVAARPGLAALDWVLFTATLFTYEQTLPVLLLIVVLRVAARRQTPFVAFHAAHLVSLGGWIWLRLALSGAKPLPPTLGEMPPRVLGNVSRTVSETFGSGALAQVYRLWTKATPGDWLAAIAAAAVVMVLVARRLSATGEAPAARWRRLAGAALGFALCAYLPVWLWWPSSRHHFLPSLGLFCAGGAGLAWLLARVPRPGQVAAVLLTGLAICLAAVADRGESRFWEESFQARRAMFQELRQDLDGQEALILADFPYLHGPALLMAPLDARWGPTLFPSPPLERPPATGSIGWAPAPEGFYVFTHNLDGPESFRFLTTRRFLVVQFRSWENGRLAYEKNPARPLSYRMLSSDTSETAANFGVTHLAARREGGGLIVSLRLTAPIRPGTYLTALFGFVHGPGFYRWGRLDRENNLDAIPVLLSDPGPAPRAGTYLFDRMLSLQSFPVTGRVQASFYLASATDAPVLLGRAEAAVTP